jgi:hypothetical protein
MSKKVLEQVLDASRMKDLQQIQYDNCLYIRGVVPSLANGGRLSDQINIGALGDFRIERFTLDYTTLIYDAQDTYKDDGVDHMAIKLTDGNTGYQLFENLIPLHLWAMPGRTRFYDSAVAFITDPLGAAPPASEPLLYPGFPFQFLLAANNILEIEASNDSDQENVFRLALWGERIKPNKTTVGAAAIRKRYSRGQPATASS